MNIEKVKKLLRKDIEALGDKVKFGKIENGKLYATIIREDGREDKVYWRINQDGRLESLWYYPVSE